MFVKIGSIVGRNVNSGTLTRNYVLSKVSQVSIFSAYTNLPISIIEHCIVTGEFIKSPIRYDDYPTCGFKEVKNRLKFKDFAGYFWGDCFDMVAHVISKLYNKTFDVSNKEDFLKILRHITLMFKDVFYGEEVDPNMTSSVINAISKLKNTKPIIEVVVRQWNKDDGATWRKNGSTVKGLNINFVYPVDQFYIDRTVNPYPKYFYDKKDPCYAYYLGKDSNGVDNIKLYFPNRPKDVTRFITNCNILEGIYNLDGYEYDYIIVTKSSKDRVGMYCLIEKMKFLYGEVNAIKIGFINVPHETYRLNDIEYDWLKHKLNPDNDKARIVSLMDNDRTGKLEAIWLYRTFAITPLLIPKEMNAKDYSELYEAIGEQSMIKEANKLITNIEYYVERSERKYNKYFGNSQESSDEPF